MKTEEKKDVNRILVEDRHLIDEALKEGVREAMLRHKAESREVVRPGRFELPAPRLGGGCSIP